MRQFKLTFLFLIFLTFLAQETYARPPGGQDDNKSDGKKENKESVNGCLENQQSLDFWQGLAILPVQFVDRNKDGTVLSGQFSSSLFVQHIDFKLLPDQKGDFFSMDGNWEEKISRRSFLKKFKKDYWLVGYLPDRGNLICEAHQMKNWGFLYANFAQDSTSVVKSVDSISFWRKLKIKPLYFYSVKDDKAYWLFFEPTVGSVAPEEVQSVIKLDDGTIARKYLKIPNDGYVDVVEHGVFLLDKNCVFQSLEVKQPKIRVGSLSWGDTKMRPKAENKEYFISNINKTYWFSFYDNDTKTLLRVVETMLKSKYNKDNDK